MRVLPSEWHPQSGVQLTWPHEATDWNYMLEEVNECFIRIAAAITEQELLLITTPEPDKVQQQIRNRVNMENVIFLPCGTNDTWARDHGAITVIDQDSPLLLDFMFNGWGLKFASGLDNQITRQGFLAKVFSAGYENHLDFVLEGGSIESDGKGTVLTTSECLLSPNRNAKLTREEIDAYLKEVFNLKNILWLDHGYLAGDDTDSHIDTLARLCPDDTIVYVKCEDPLDEHYPALQKMEEQLQTFHTIDGAPYNLVALPMCDPVYADNERLPATYANFLIINGAVLYPTYNQAEKDKLAGEILQTVFPGRKIVGIPCTALIKQHGSLHCVTMQYPEGVLKK